MSLRDNGRPATMRRLSLVDIGALSTCVLRPCCDRPPRVEPDWEGGPQSSSPPQPASRSSQVSQLAKRISRVFSYAGDVQVMSNGADVGIMITHECSSSKRRDGTHVSHLGISWTRSSNGFP
ncbi:hypothetical protein MTO96_000436 [Rhipicephalus appendiculatus]